MRAVEDADLPFPGQRRLDGSGSTEKGCGINHAGVIANCSSCHNGVLATGKGPAHIDVGGWNVQPENIAVRQAVPTPAGTVGAHRLKPTITSKQASPITSAVLFVWPFKIPDARFLAS